MLEVLYMSKNRNNSHGPKNDKNSPELTNDEKNQNRTYTPNLEKTERKKHK